MMEQGWIIYDGECLLCRRTVETLARWDRKNRFAFVPYQEEQVFDRWPDLDASACAEAIHLIQPDGGVLKGSDAMVAILKVVRPGLARLLTLPVIGRMVPLVYGWISHHREFFRGGK